MRDVRSTVNSFQHSDIHRAKDLASNAAYCDSEYPLAGPDNWNNQLDPI